MMPCEITDYAGFYNGNWWIHKSYFYGPASLVTSDPRPVRRGRRSVGRGSTQGCPAWVRSTARASPLGATDPPAVPCEEGLPSRDDDSVVSVTATGGPSVSSGAPAPRTGSRPGTLRTYSMPNQGAEARSASKI